MATSRSRTTRTGCSSRFQFVLQVRNASWFAYSGAAFIAAVHVLYHCVVAVLIVCYGRRQARIAHAALSSRALPVDTAMPLHPLLSSARDHALSGTHVRPGRQARRA